MNKNLLVFLLAIFGAALGWQLGLQHQTPDSTTGQVEAGAQGLPDTAWQNLDGGQNRLDEWLGQVLIVNHWATWCEPCRKEIPMFMDFRNQNLERGLELIGIAHDNEEDVRRYVDSMGMDYPQLLAGRGQGQKWLAALGNSGSLPLTLVYDREGNLRAKKLGLMSESELRRAVDSLL